MTYDETTLFRHFMQSKGVLNNFEYLYRNHRFDDRSIEEFYEETPADAVIMTAFDFSGFRNSIFSAKYWESLDSKWQWCLHDFRTQGTKVEPRVRCGKCGKMKYESEFRYTKSGRLHKFCIECEGGKPTVVPPPPPPKTKVCSRCGKEKPLEEFNICNSTKDGRHAYCRECMREYNREKTQSQTQTKEKTNMEDYTFYDFEKQPSTHRIVQGTAALNFKNSNKYLIFGIEESRYISKSGLLKMRIRVDNITGALHFVFNKTQGATAAVKDNNVKVVNADLVDFLMNYLSLGKKEGRYIINIGNDLSKTKDYITYKVTVNK